MSRVLDVEPDTVKRLKEKGGNWAMYRNVAMDSIMFGQVQFLRFGPGCTYEAPPAQMPDTYVDSGWKYALVGTIAATDIPDDGKITLEDA